VGIYRSLTNMNVEIEAAQFHFCDYINSNFFAVLRTGIRPFWELCAEVLIPLVSSFVTFHKPNVVRFVSTGRCRSRYRYLCDMILVDTCFTCKPVVALKPDPDTDPNPAFYSK
jgi:hypothetical protein